MIELYLVIEELWVNFGQICMLMLDSRVKVSKGETCYLTDKM